LGGPEYDQKCGKEMTTQIRGGVAGQGVRKRHRRGVSKKLIREKDQRSKQGDKATPSGKLTNSS